MNHKNDFICMFFVLALTGNRTVSVSQTGLLSFRKSDVSRQPQY